MIATNAFLRNNRALLLICLAAWVLRLPWLGFGLPQQFHPDEWIYFTTAFKFFKFSFVNNGLPISNSYSYLIFAGYLCYVPLWLLKNGFSSLHSLYASFYAYGNPYLDYANPHFLLIARLTSVTITVLAGLAAGLFLSKRVSKPVMLTTVALFFLLPLEFLYSRFGVPDLALTAALLVGMVLVFRFTESPSILRWTLASAAGVTAFSIKQPGAVLFAPMLFGLWRVRTQCKGTKLLACVAAGMAVIIIGVCLLSPNMVFSDAGTSNMHTLANMLFHFEEDPANSAHHEMLSTPYQYLFVLCTDYGPAILSVCVLGFLAACRRRSVTTALWLLLLVPFFGVFQFAALKMDRYIIPFTALFFVWTFPIGLTKLLEVKIFRWAPVLVSLMVLLFIFPLVRVASYFNLLAAGDTRLTAAKWLERHDYSHWRIAREIHVTPLLPPGYGKPVLEEWTVGIHSIDDLKKQGVDMLIISPQNRFMFRADSRVFRNYTSYLDSLQLVAHFESVHRLVTYNPEIDILLLPSPMQHDR